MYVGLDQNQLNQLRERVPDDSVRLQPLGDLWELESSRTDDLGVVDGPIGDIVQRCIGTVTALGDHQAEGGTVILGYPDGSFRPITINLLTDGQIVPPTMSASNSVIKRLRRAGRQR